MNTAGRLAISLMVGTSLLSMGSTAEAQSPPPLSSADVAPVAATSPPPGLGDIVVTARRRAESLQSTPVTVDVFTGAQLQAKGINDVQRLFQATPGVNFDAFPRAAPRPFFRGIGSANQGAGGDPSSVAFLDGVYLGRAAMLGIDFYDLERVEVLKGPQGTLFGKNVVGGAVNFITAKPKADAAASARFTAGEYGERDGNLMLNMPLSDTIATRIVLGAISNRGFRKTVDGRPLDDDDKKSARVQTIFGLGTGTTLLVGADIAAQDLGQTSRYNVRTQPFHATGHHKGYEDVADPRTADPDRYGFIDTHTGGARAEFNSDALGFATLTATAAWRTLRYASSDDLDGTTAAENRANGVIVPAIQVLQNERADSYSAETRLTSRTAGPFSWVGGLYFNHDDIRRGRETQIALVPTTINEYDAKARNRSYAAFGEAQYKFDFGFALIAGARYTDERKTYEIVRLTGSRAAPTTAYSTFGDPGVAHQKLATWRVGADWRVSPQLFVFGTVSTGFKAGAFQEQPSNAALARTPTAPEKVTNYEIGVKSDLFDRHVRANVSAFVADYRDLQTIQVIPDASAGSGGSRVSTDTGNATIKGIETEVVLAPVTFADLSVRYTFLDATFDRLTQTSAILADGTAVVRDLSGNRLSRTPRHALDVDLGFTSPKRRWGWLRALVSAQYQSDVYDDNDNDFIEYRRARTLWDASLTYNVDERFSAQFWVHNFTNVTYRTFQTDQANGLFVQYGPPRQFGVTLNARF